MEQPLVSLVMMTWATVKLATMLLVLVGFMLKGMLFAFDLFWKYSLFFKFLTNALIVCLGISLGHGCPSVQVLVQ